MIFALTHFMKSIPFPHIMSQERLMPTAPRIRGVFPLSVAFRERVSIAGPGRYTCSGRLPFFGTRVRCSFLVLKHTKKTHGTSRHSPWILPAPCDSAAANNFVLKDGHLRLQLGACAHTQLQQQGASLDGAVPLACDSPCQRSGTSCFEMVEGRSDLDCPGLL